MFNRIVHKRAEMFLYNSLTGLDGIVYVPDKMQNSVKSILENPEKPCNDKILQQLVDHGFLVSADFDEKRKRTYLISNYLNSSSLQLIVHVSNGCNFRCRYCYTVLNPNE